MSNFRTLPADMRHMRRACLRHDFHSITDQAIINAALYFDGLFRVETDREIRSELASILISFYNELHRRFRRAPLDAALPHAGATGHAAEIVDDIAPFMSRDLWIMALEPHHPHRHSSGPRQQTVNMEGETLRPHRRGGGVPQFRDPSQLEGMTPVPPDQGGLGDIAGALDTGNSVLGLIAFGLESFALDVIGTLAAPIISVFGLAATWADRDRQVARIHAAHQTIESLYDMSMPFRDPELFRRSYAQWPAIRPPIEATVPTGNSNDAQIERSARLEARNRARQHVMDLEGHPIYRVVRHNGRELRVPVTGKVYLYYLNVAARQRHISVRLYLRDVMQARTGLNLGMFRWN